MSAAQTETAEVAEKWVPSVEPDFDAIVVGGGVAGCVAAIELARAGREVVLIERGDMPGSKNLSGGVFYSRVMEQVFPDFIEEAPIERRITRNTLSFLNPISFVNIDYWDQRLAEPVNAVTVLRAKLDAWLSEKCEEEGVTVMPGVRVDNLLFEGDHVVGIVAGDEELRAKVVIAADGVNSFLAQYAGIRAKEPMKHLAVGVKSVIRLPREVLEDRFTLTGDEGRAFAIVGDATQGVAGGGFLYTNEDTISIGVVLRLDDLDVKGLTASGVHDHFLAHPAIAPYLKDGELLEYGCHLTIEDGPHMVSHDQTRPGLLLVGDAAGFTLNTGMTIRGMDLAAESARCAARAANESIEEEDHSQEAMDKYVAYWKESWLGKDMATYAKAPAFLETDEMYGDVGLLLADVFHNLYDHDLTPRRRLVKAALDAVKTSRLSLLRLARIGATAIRAL